MIGKINSIETFGTVDGPGIRYVVFLQGCNYRCQYCHNPETWDMCQGIEQSVDDLVSDILRYKRYIEGVTVSGGEPLLQIDFVRDLFARVKDEGLSTCLDTNGGIFDESNVAQLSKLNELLDVTDIVMLDIKHIDDDKHVELTKQSNENVLKFAKYLDKKCQDLWLRYVLVPTINDSDDIVLRWKDFADGLSNVSNIEVLPYHSLAIEKYNKLNLEYPLKDIKEPSVQNIKRVEDILKNYKEKN